MQEEAPALHSFADGRPTGPDPRDIIAALVGRFEDDAKSVG